MNTKRLFNLQFFGEESADNGGGANHFGQPEKTFTQADVDRLVKDRLERERKKYADYDELKKAKDDLEKLKQGELSDVEKLKKQNEELKTRAEAAEAKIKDFEVTATKAKLLAEAGLPTELVDRLKGTTQEEILADIETIKKILKPTQASIGSPTNPGSPPSETPEAKGKRMAEERAKRKIGEGHDPWKKHRRSDRT